MKRQTVLVAILGIFLLGALGYVVYSLVVSPILQARASAKTTQVENARLDSENAAIQNRLKRLVNLNKRSLPLDLDMARREYDTALTHLLTGVRVGVYTITLNKDQTTDPPPMIEKDRPAYRKVACTITMNKVDVGTFAAFLEGYYRLNLLQRITSISVKRSESNIGSKKDTPEARRDLEVRLVTEAAILDGTDKKTLLMVPEAEGGVLGGAGLYGLRNTPVVARGIKPIEIERVLARPDREYSLLPYRDIFHGPYPVPEPPPTKPKTVDVDIPVLPRVDAYIKFTTLIGQSDGTALASIRDMANNYYYDITLTRKGEKVAVVVLKQDYYSTGGVRDTVKTTGGLLAIADKTSSTKRTFKVYGLNGTSLLLGENEIGEPVKEVKPDKGGRPIPKAAAPPVNPLHALVGGIVAAAPRSEKFYIWEIGQPLSKLRLLKPSEAEKALIGIADW